MLLAEPLRVGHLTLKHRMVMGPMGTRMWTTLGEPTPNVLELYRRRAAGAALITIGPGQVHEAYDNGPRPALWREESIAPMRVLTSLIHDGGAPVIMQLHHDGPGASPAVSPSGVPCLIISGVIAASRPLELAEVEGFRDRFVAAAQRTQRAGFDGVELGGQAGYLLGQFLSPRMNLRTDRYGGSESARMLFALEIVRGIRAACGQDFVIGYALSADELKPGGMTPADCLPFAKELESAGLDYLDVRVGTHETFALSERATAHNRYQSRAGIWEHAAVFKRALSIPVFCSTQGCYDPLLWEQALQAGQTDAIQIAKPLLVDPDLPGKVLDGRSQDVRPCLLCMYCLEPTLFFDKTNPRVYCAVNAEVGAETEMRMSPAAPPRKVVVIGGGPAGMEAARVAALRGHHVTLLERGPQLGGNLLTIGRCVAGDKYQQLLDWMAAECIRAGVNVRLNTPGTPALIRDDAFEVGVLATGTTPAAAPAVKGSDKRRLLQATDVINGTAVSGHVVILGGGQVGVQLAILLGTRDQPASITLIETEAVKELGQGMAKLERTYASMVLLPKFNVQAHIGARLEEVREREVLIRDADDRKLKIKADSLVLALNGSPADELEATIRAMDGLELHVIGDAARTRTLREAIHGAARVASAI